MSGKQGLTVPGHLPEWQVDHFVCQGFRQILSLVEDEIGPRPRAGQGPERWDQGIPSSGIRGRTATKKSSFPNYAIEGLLRGVPQLVSKNDGL